MASKRRTEAAEVRFGPAVRALVICGLLSTVAVGYVGQKHRNGRLQAECERLREAGVELRLVIQKLEQRLAERRAQVELQVRHLGLPLAPPRLGQVVILPQALKRATPGQGGQMAQMERP